MSYTKNITIREVFASIYATEEIENFFRKGLEIDNDRLAISALEELILRGEGIRIARSLNVAFRRGWLRKESTLIALLGRTLKDSCRGVDLHLCHYGIGLCRGDFQSPSIWVNNHPEEFGDHNSKAAREARMWAHAVNISSIANNTLPTTSHPDSSDPSNPSGSSDILEDLSLESQEAY